MTTAVVLADSIPRQDSLAEKLLADTVASMETWSANRSLQRGLCPSLAPGATTPAVLDTSQESDQAVSPHSCCYPEPAEAIDAGLQTRRWAATIEAEFPSLRTTRRRSIAAAGDEVVQIPASLFLVVYDRLRSDLAAWARESLEAMTRTRYESEPDRVLATVLFTDIVGSTKRAVEVGDREWKRLLEEHDSMARSEVIRFHGRMVKTTGDGVLALFDGPAAAVRCARSIADGARGFGLDVRAGVHTGEIHLRGDDVVGIGVHLAQRVCSLAAAEEVLVSRTVVDLTTGSGLEFEDLGEHALKGLPGNWQLFSMRPSRRLGPLDMPL